jgi:hypothetical protein
MDELDRIKKDLDNARQYTKKPIPIKAVQVHTEVEIKTLEGTMKASPGDYIIRGVQGELYPCKKEIFEETYQKLLTTEEQQRMRVQANRLYSEG